MVQLSDVEARILGSLVEKALATPMHYPLTFNALRSACNQKSSREPVMNLDVDALGQGVAALVEKGLAVRREIAGTRVPKFEHRIEDLAGTTDPKVTGTLCVLLLRGPQTPGELKGRTDRLCRFESTAQVESLLRELAAKDDPFIARAPRRPGQKEGRYRQLFTVAPTPSPDAAAVPAPPDLPQRVEALETQVRALQDRLDRLDPVEAEIRTA